MKTLQKKLINWYQENRRILPWRNDKNPYKIWISEVMLQQTTVVAVIPFYENFINKFPDLPTLAAAPIEEIYDSWAGLGYYSRARNLHKSAQILADIDFPQTSAELLELPGFGPYTSRAVASLAFEEKVGVLDGNVIRVLSRLYDLDLEWWTTSGRQKLQTISDQLAQTESSSLINQGLMELGATVCTPHNPVCLLCPWSKNCLSLKANTVLLRPKKKPRKKSEVWVWKAKLIQKSGRWAVLKNDYAPFLKNQWIFPGEVLKLKIAPKSFDLTHGITHHSIYVQINQQKSFNKKGLQWVSIEELRKITPSSLLQKILQHS